jgi:2-phosphosulfolactate phosphatase
MTEILITQGHRPPPNPGGATVVIDVIRAFTTAHFAFQGGAREIHLVATAPEALAMKQQQPDLLLAGEISALPIDGFDFGNSPLEMTRADLRGRTLVQRTTNGVIATLAARDSAVVLVAGLINAAATAEWLNSQHFPRVLLVASHPDGDEDVACAEYMRGLLGGEGISLEEARQRTRGAHAAKKFLDGRHPRLHAEDIAMAASEDRNAHPLRVSYDPQPTILPL